MVTKRYFLLLACTYFVVLFFRLHSKPMVFFVLPIFLYLAGKEYWKEREWIPIFVRGCPILFLFVIGWFRVGAEVNLRNAYLPNLEEEQELVIVGEIDKFSYKNEQFYYYFKDCYLQLSKSYIPCNQVLVYMSSDDYSVGQILRIKGKVHIFETATNEGMFDRAKFYQSQKIDFAINDAVVCDVSGNPRMIPKLAYRIKQKLSQVFLEQTGKKKGGLLCGMLLGEKGELELETKTLYQDAGISHVLAISGLHVSVLGMGIFHFLRKRKVGYWSATFVSGSLLMFYGILVGNGIPTKRAIGMLLISNIASAIGRRSDLLNSLGLMVFLFLFENPFLIYYSGFWFSISAILGIGIVGRTFEKEFERFDEKKEPQKYIGWKQILKQKRKDKIKKIRASVLMSVGIWITTLPLVAWNYYEIPMYSVAINMMVIPLMSLLLKCAMYGGAVGIWFPYVAKVFFFPCNVILDLFEWICCFSANLPGDKCIVGKTSVVKMVVFYVILALLLGFIRNGRMMTKWKAVVTSIFFLLMSFTIFFSFPKKAEIVFLDVGQGDGIYIQTEDQMNLFIDGGSTDARNVGKYRILPFLKAKGVRRIDCWFVSHLDNDHCSGLIECMESGYPIDSIVFSKWINKGETFQKIEFLANENGISISYLDKGQSVKTKEWLMYCLYPTRQSSNKGDDNENSLVLLYETKDCKGLFAGDISDEIEREMVLFYSKSSVLCNLDFMKAIHHGSKESNSRELLELIDTKKVVISCGRNNRYGHPHQETIERFEDFGCEIFYTMLEGQVTLE